MLARSLLAKALWAMSPILLEPEEGRRREVALQGGADLFQRMAAILRCLPLVNLYTHGRSQAVTILW